MRLHEIRTLLAAGALLVAGCGSGVAPSDPGSSAAGTGTDTAAMTRDREESHHGPRAFIYPRHARVDGKTTLGWIPEFWRYIFSVPASENPMLEAGPRPLATPELVDSADCGVGQTGPVFFVPGEQHDVYSRSCTVPARTPVLWPIWSLFNDYPCPDPTFQPAPGQSLQDFLARGARAFDDAVKNLAATVDGRPVDPSLTATFDSCVTGSRQEGVADGWFVLLRLSPGDHTLVVTATAPSEHATSQTFLLHVQGDRDDD